MKFNSQICTTREQSERLLSLGLKKETADMVLCKPFDYEKHKYSDGCVKIVLEEEEDLCEDDIPAWSLHRLIEMMPEYVHKGNANFERTLFPNSVDYFRDLYKDCGDVVISFDSPNLYDRLIHCIEWLIKEGYFPKEYLEE